MIEVGDIVKFKEPCELSYEFEAARGILLRVKDVVGRNNNSVRLEPLIPNADYKNNWQWYQSRLEKVG